MRINTFNFCTVVVLAAIFTSSLSAAESTDAERIAGLEARLLQLEARLSQTEQDTKEVKVLASSAVAGGSNASILGNQATFDILSNSAWRNLRWTQAEQWEGVRPGVSMAAVVEALGHPPRSVDSLKPRVDEVFYYETSIRDDGNSLRGKISFRNDSVLTVQKPNFKANKAAQ